jgi:hypothetical protein
MPTVVGIVIETWSAVFTGERVGGEPTLDACP